MSRRIAHASWLAPNPNDVDVLASVRDLWRTYLTVTHPPFDPAVAEATAARVATGRAAAELIDVARRDATAGVTIRGQINSHPRVVSQNATSAFVVDCVDDGTGAFRADGTRLDADDPRPHRIRLRVVRTHRGWRVASVDQSEAPCVLG